MYQQPPPPPNWQPGQFAPVPPPPPKPTLRQRFNRLSRKAKFGLGCSTLLLIFALCICSSVVATGGSQSGTPAAGTSATTQQPTATTEPTKVPTTIPVKHTAPTPRPAPTQPVPAQAPTGVNGNPWGYNFTPGNLIYSPNAAFCSYFTCVSTFWTKTNGYVAECGNGEYTHSGGVSGACSRDGGVLRALYSH